MLKTIFGSANLDKRGYYRITSIKEGNCYKLLHRLIWEKNYGEIPDGYVIHHKDEDKTNNCVLNLQLMTKEEHRSLHTKGENNPMYGKSLSPEHRKKLSESLADLRGENHPFYGKKHSLSTRLRISEKRNKTGILHVFKAKNKRYKKGWCWRYQYYEDGIQKSIQSVDIQKLKDKVLAKGMDWIELDMEE